MLENDNNMSNNTGRSIGKVDPEQDDVYNNTQRFEDSVREIISDKHYASNCTLKDQEKQEVKENLSKI